MTAIQLNAQIWRDMGILADSEPMMKRVAKYLHKLVSEKKADPTEFTREEFFARIEKSRQQIREGKVYRMLPEETLDEFLDRVG